MRAFRQPEPKFPLRECHLVAGLSCAVETNSEDVLRAAHRYLRQAIGLQAVPDFRLTFWVDADASGGPPWPQPHFRGLNHLVYAGLSRDSSLLIDLHRRRAVGRFSPAMARDAGLWERVIFPNAIGLMSEALGLTALHCACVVREGAGMLLSGGAGAGKSTLALALARAGFAFLSDDWTYFSGAGPQLRGWGAAGTLKLLTDAARHFPELTSLAPNVSANGELAYEFDPEAVFDVARALTCDPVWLIFLERRNSAGHSMTRLPPAEVAARLEYDLEDLPPMLSAVSDAQSSIVAELAGRQGWLLQHGESPGELAQFLERFCSDPPPAAPGPWTPLHASARPVRTGPDIIRRFTPTPLAAEVRTSSGSIRLETNSPEILRLVHGAAGAGDCPAAASGSFLWRLVSDPVPGALHPWRAPSGFSVEGLHLVTFGQHNFLAVDAGARVAVGFVDERLLKDAGFGRSFVASLIAATAAAIGTSP